MYHNTVKCFMYTYFADHLLKKHTHKLVVAELLGIIVIFDSRIISNVYILPTLKF